MMLVTARDSSGMVAVFAERDMQALDRYEADFLLAGSIAARQDHAGNEEGKENVVADHIEAEQIVETMDVVPYDEMKSRVNSGDLFFASGDYLVSQAIQKFTGSPWSHVGIVFRLESIGRLLLLESVEDMGVRFAPLSKYLTDYEGGKPYKGRAVIARCSGVDASIISKLAAFGIDELTRPYDKNEIATIVARIALGIGKKEKDREYICSELVYECFAHAGIEFAYDERGFISPENVWRSERVSIISRVL